MNNKIRNTLWITLIVILFLSCVIIFNEIQNDNSNELIEAYANAEEIKYNPLTKKYTFDNYINISKEELNNSNNNK